MHKISAKIATLFLLLIIVSCGKSNSKIVLETEAGIENLNTLLDSQFDQEKAIHTLSISSKNRTSNEVDQVSILFTKNEQQAIWFYSMATATLFKPEPKGKTTKKVNMLALKEFNTNAILKHYNAAVAMVKKETDEFENFQLAGFDFHVDKNANITHAFNLLAIKIGNETSYYGDRLEGNIFRFNFSVNGDQKLKCTKGLDVFKN